MRYPAHSPRPFIHQGQITLSFLRQYPTEKQSEFGNQGPQNEGNIHAKSFVLKKFIHRARRKGITVSKNRDTCYEYAAQIAK